MLISIILFSPLLGSLFAALMCFFKKNILAAIIPIMLLSLGLIAAFVAFGNVQNGEILQLDLLRWIHIGSFEVNFSFLIDGVSAVMILVVLIVSLLVHIYSIGYMSADLGFNKFFCFLSAFVFSMLVLVMSDNFLGLFIGWEGVGLCSWLLIGFWHNKLSASWAANEAFIMNRIADLGLLLGIFLIFDSIGSLKFGDVFSQIGNINPSSIMLIGILLFIGAMGKSAQFPFHTWLADAMEGPTPVSALIHAATMVTAGVYLVIRANPIYNLIPSFSLMIAYLGAFVAIFAASMALVNKDLKRIIAYSTLSQLGYMFVAAGLGFYWIALFHLATHAFFKSLLFLGAGNVMHAMNDKLDITKMGGLFKSLKYTAILMIIASVALCGIYPFAGFFSKDKILESAFYSGEIGLYIILLCAAFLTAFYSFRLIMLVFFVPNNHNAHPHEASKVMLFSMLPLGILSIIAGLFEKEFHHYLSLYLPSDSPHLEGSIFIALLVLALFAGISGIICAIFVYKKGSPFKLNFISKILENQYYFPKLYEIIFIKPYYKIARFFWREIDLKIIDFMVDFIAETMLFMGGAWQKMQNGKLNYYILYMFCGIFALLLGIWV